MKARLTKDFFFESAQTLPKVPPGHKCGKMHGHSFRVEVSVEGEVNADTGWIYDHAQIGDAMKPLVAQLDHAYLNDIPGIGKSDHRTDGGMVLAKTSPQCAGLCEIVVHETPWARCSYRGD